MKLPHWIPGTAIAGYGALLAGCHSLPALHYYALDAVNPARVPRIPAVRRC